MVKLLVDAGADVCINDNYGVPLLFYVFSSSDLLPDAVSVPRRMRQILQILMDAGADPTACDGEDATLTHCVISQFYSEGILDSARAVYIHDIMAQIHGLIAEGSLKSKDIGRVKQ
jgi:hypothetical protein